MEHKTSEWGGSKHAPGIMLLASKQEGGASRMEGRQEAAAHTPDGGECLEESFFQAVFGSDDVTVGSDLVPLLQFVQAAEGGRDWVSKS